MANYYSEKSKISINQLIEGNLDLVKKNCLANFWKSSEGS